MLFAMANTAAVAVMFDCGCVAEFAGAEFMFDTPTRNPVRGRIKKSTLHILERAIIGARAAEAVDFQIGESSSGSSAKGFAVGNGEGTRKAGDQSIGIGIIEDLGHRRTGSECGRL
jgi:hypothetical protein